MPNTGQGASAHDWWRTAAIYEVYVRSFADGNGDGIGDLAGVRARLPYLAELGIDAIWFAPWYPSPMADAGYDVADYRAIEPLFGSLAEAEKLIAEAHDARHQDHHRHRPEPRLGPAAVVRRCAGRPGRLGGAGPLPLPARPGRRRRAAAERLDRRCSAARPGPGRHGRAAAPTGAAEGTGEWYLHLFSPGQPDFNWAHPDVRAEFASVLRFWFDRGVDGFRIDSAALLAKDPALADLGPARTAGPDVRPGPARDRPRGAGQPGRRIRSSTGTRCTGSTGNGGGSRTPTPGTGC